MAACACASCVAPCCTDTDGTPHAHAHTTRVNGRMHGLHSAGIVYPGAFDERALPGARRQLSKGRRHLRRGLLHAGRLRPTRQPRRQRCRLFGGALRCRPAVSRHARVAHSRHQLFVFEPRSRMPRVLSAWLCLGAVAGFHAPPASGVLPSRARCGGRELAGGRMQAGVATLAVHHSCVHVSLACTCTQSVQVSDTDETSLRRRRCQLCMESLRTRRSGLPPAGGTFCLCMG